MTFVLLHGAPGVGKLTVGRELAALTGFKLFDSHASIDVVRRVFDFPDEPFWPLVLRFRFDVFERAAEHGVDLITTGAYVYPDDTEIVEDMFSLTEKHGGDVVLVHLICRPDVLDTSITAEGRANKMHLLEAARADRAKKDYFTQIPGRYSLQIDNSEIAPGAVARLIAEHYGLSTR